MVMAAMAMAAGVLAESWQMEVPSPMVSVDAPHQASGVSASLP